MDYLDYLGVSWIAIKSHGIGTFTTMNGYFIIVYPTRFAPHSTSADSLFIDEHNFDDFVSVVSKIENRVIREF